MALLGVLRRWARRITAANAAPVAAPVGEAVAPPPPAPSAGGLALALQGGGAFGAFTWGVLERLLEERVFKPLALSGASAGAVNAVALATGWADGGAEGARERLARIWTRVGTAGSGLLGLDLPGADLARSVGSTAFRLTSRLLSPYQLNPLNLNPLRTILEDELDFTALRRADAPRVVISATRVRDGRPRLFDNDDIDLDALLASTTLPMLHRAVEIGGESYWDGGFTLNPPIRPLLPAGSPILLVQALPVGSGETPVTAPAIQARLSQVVFSRALEDEYERADEALARLGRAGALQRLAIDAHAAAALGADGLRADLEHLIALKSLGRAQAESWLAAHG